MTVTGRLDLVALDAPDIERLAAFYTALTGWETVRKDADWIAVRTADGQPVASPRAPDHVAPRGPGLERPQQVHLDLLVDGYQAAAERAVGLGATRLADGPTWITLADPAGHPFDLCQRDGVGPTMELFAAVLAKLSLGWLLAPLALVVALGGVAHLAPWILGPAKGVATVAHEGLAPSRLGRLNRNDVPVTLLLVQGVGGSVFALLFLFVPSVSTSYWMLSAVTAQIIIVMYALMFAAVIRLRYVEPDAPRPYRIPGGLPGVWLVGGVGLVGCVVSFLLGFVPPSQLKTGDTAVYVLLLALATVVLSLPPFVFALLQRRAGPAPGRPREA